MMSKTTSGFPDVHQGLQQMLPVTEYLVSPSAELNPGSGSHSSSLLFYLSILKDKHTQMQTVAGVLLSPEQNLPESTSMAISSLNSIVQEIIGIATSLMFTCQQIIALGSTTPDTATCADELHQQQSDHDHRLPHQSNFGNNRGVFNNIGPYIRGQSFFPSIEADALDWFGESCNNNNTNTNNNNSSSNNCNRKDGDRSVAISETNNSRGGLSLGDEHNEGCRVLSPKNNDIIELDVADLLAKYTHYCQVCGKGFKRDANLRMHMRAHGDEYKTSAALSNPMKNKGSSGGGSDCSMSTKPKKYSCPHEGCRWNQRHAKFQPLKSMICVKNHYKRSHCPKMYMCKRCNQKQFSVLSDLRTHEKHCGDPRWQCSCGTTFSRKDKLMGHVGLFVGHKPAINGSQSSGKFEPQALQLQIDGSSRRRV